MYPSYRRPTTIEEPTTTKEFTKKKRPLKACERARNSEVNWQISNEDKDKNMALVSLPLILYFSLSLILLLSIQEYSWSRGKKIHQGRSPQRRSDSTDKRISVAHGGVGCKQKQKQNSCKKKTRNRPPQEKATVV
jgi:hypothetical protein